MIINLIVFSALVIAGVYILFWICSKHFRARVEAPKYRFQAQLSVFENTNHQNRGGSESHASD